MIRFTGISASVIKYVNNMPKKHACIIQCT